MIAGCQDGGRGQSNRKGARSLVCVCKILRAPRGRGQRARHFRQGHPGGCPEQHFTLSLSVLCYAPVTRVSEHHTPPRPSPRLISDSSACALLLPAQQARFKYVEDLAAVWAEWVEMELRHENYKRALEVLKRVTAEPLRPRKLSAVGPSSSCDLRRLCIRVAPELAQPSLACTALSPSRLSSARMRTLACRRRSARCRPRSASTGPCSCGRCMPTSRRAWALSNRQPPCTTASWSCGWQPRRSS